MVTQSSHSLQPAEHIRVRLLRNLLKEGVEASSFVKSTCPNSTPRIQAYLAKERTWIITFSCTESMLPKVCQSFLCSRMSDGSVGVMPISGGDCIINDSIEGVYYPKELHE